MPYLFTLDEAANTYMLYFYWRRACQLNPYSKGRKLKLIEKFEIKNKKLIWKMINEVSVLIHVATKRWIYLESNGASTIL